MTREALMLTNRELLPDDGCEFARLRYHGIAKWRYLWTLLTFIFGALFVVFVTACLLWIFIDEQTAGAIASAGAAVVDFAGVLFVTARRAEAVKEEQAAYADATAACGGSPAGADDVRSRYKILGVR